MNVKAFQDGFSTQLEKRSARVLSTGELAEKVRAGELSPHELQTLSYHLRNRDIGRLLQSIAYTGGGALLGTLAGAGAKRVVTGEPFTIRSWPSVLGGIVGGGLGRMLEAATLDPIDRLFYSDPRAAIKRLGTAKIPIVVNPTQKPLKAFEYAEKLNILPGL